MNDNSNQSHRAWHYLWTALEDADELAHGAVLDPLAVDHARQTLRNVWFGQDVFATGVVDLGDERFDIRRAIEVVPLGEYESWEAMTKDLSRRYAIGVAGLICCDGYCYREFEWIDPSEQDPGLSMVAMVAWCDEEQRFFPMLVTAAPRQ